MILNQSDETIERFGIISAFPFRVTPENPVADLRGIVLDPVRVDRSSVLKRECCNSIWNLGIRVFGVRENIQAKSKERSLAPTNQRIRSLSNALERVNSVFINELLLDQSPAIQQKDRHFSQHRVVHRNNSAFEATIRIDHDPVTANLITQLAGLATDTSTFPACKLYIHLKRLIGIFDSVVRTRKWFDRSDGRRTSTRDTVAQDVVNFVTVTGILSRRRKCNVWQTAKRRLSLNVGRPNKANQNSQPKTVSVS